MSAIEVIMRSRKFRQLARINSRLQKWLADLNANTGEFAPLMPTVELINRVSDAHRYLCESESILERILNMQAIKLRGTDCVQWRTCRTYKDGDCLDKRERSEARCRQCPAYYCPATAHGVSHATT